ncbi:efflux RND transporter permease subunit [Hyphomicrobium sp.]|uniref:efflux RND transporter permease subunit n=1 Tax=Hyphomicrobium sp. TaxID=82 RepID=UPI000FA9FEF3|nr:efflux RND transporter permease subunit [Hyphomicrobium sp.]RUP08241.1 MAG: efflux RND transporter permease subunit [Hyphomicrobium sp.]
MESFNLSAWAVRHPAVILFLIIASTIAGLWSYAQLGRAEDPNFTIKTMVVQVAWPGAVAEDVQKLVAEPLEKRLQEMTELDYVKTYSRPGAAVFQVQLKDSVHGRAASDAWYQIRKKLTDSKGELPEGAIGPFFNDEYGDVFAAVYMLTGDGVSRADLKRYAQTLQSALQRVKDASKVVLVGDVPERIFVELSYKKLATLGIPAQAIFDAVRDQNAVVSAGTVQTSADEVEVRVSGAFKGADAVAAVPIEAGGKIFRLGDIASVKRGYEDPAQFLVTHKGKPAVGVAVAMADNANVLDLGKRLNAAVDEVRQTIPLGVEIEQIADQPRVVEESVGEFLRSFAEALVIVLAVSFISLGMRAGVVVALAVPLVLAIVFVAMSAAGMNLDRITLGALIIALGLLVDDAIIAVEMMMVKIEQGYDRMKAASFAWESTAFPMLTGTLVTASGFLPVGFAKSTAGEYAGNIFWVVALALVISWFVAVLFTPYIGVRLLPGAHAEKGQPAAKLADTYDTRVYRTLRRLVSWALHWRWLVIAATILAFAGSMAGMGFVQQQFFPTSSRPELFIETRLPEGSSIEATSAAAKEAEALLAGDHDVVTYTTYIGQGSPRFFLALNPVLPNPSFALTVIMTKGAEARERLKVRLESAIAGGAVPQARVRIDRLNFGPPVGFPVQFRVMGPDAAKVREIAGEVRNIMRTEPNAIDPQFDWNEQVKNVQFVVDQDRARAFGLNTAQISQTLATLLSGATVSEYREGTELVKVVARATPDERLNLGSISDLMILTRGGKSVPLAQVESVKYGFEEPILWRRNRDLTLTVRADVAPGVQPPTVTSALLPKLESLKSALPSGYRIETGGAVEESEKANVALFSVFPAMFAAMLAILMFQVQSFSKLFLVFSTAPLGLIGAVAALLVFNVPFGFVALLGVIALAGMIMRNTVILVDQIDHDRDAGLSPWDAIIESTVRRSRPVILTSLAAILAMIPLTRSVFWGPMAYSMMGGLMVATVLTIFFLPALYAVWFGVGKEDKGVVNAVERPLRPLDGTADRRRRSASVGMRLQSRG